jgi:hypothetical protein
MVVAGVLEEGAAVVRADTVAGGVGCLAKRRGVARGYASDVLLRETPTAFGFGLKSGE